MRSVLAWASPAAIVVAVVIVAAIPVFVVRKRRFGMRQAIRSTALDAGVVASLAVVLVLTVALEDGDVETEIRLVPFQKVLAALAAGDRPGAREALLDIALNFALFVPLGVAAALRFPRTRRTALLAAAAVLSMTIEVAQATALRGRTADSTDVLTNVAGSLAGVAIVAFARGVAIARPSGQPSQGGAKTN